MASIVALSGGTTLGGSYCAAAVETNRTKVREADRKSTRLNSSQGYISYAVFCLKKKNYSPAGAWEADSMSLLLAPTKILPGNSLAHTELRASPKLPAQRKHTVPPPNR